MSKTWSSELTKETEEFDKINNMIKNMTPEQLKEFRNSFYHNDMGFDGAEFLEDDNNE